MIIGLKRTISELKSCPAGFGLLIKLDLTNLELITSADCFPASSCERWSRIEPFEVSCGFHTIETCPNMEALKRIVLNAIAHTGSEVYQTEERSEYIEKAIAALQVEGDMQP